MEPSLTSGVYHKAGGAWAQRDDVHGALAPPLPFHRAPVLSVLGGATDKNPPNPFETPSPGGSPGANCVPLIAYTLSIGTAIDAQEVPTFSDSILFLPFSKILFLVFCFVL